MKLAIRIIVGIIVVILTMVIFNVTVNYFKERQYKYLRFNGEWGISTDCYLENQIAFCLIDDKYMKVVQFYEI